MKRLYFLTKSISEVDNVAEDLHRAGVSDGNFHVLSNNKAELSDHRIPMTSPLHERDIVRCMERGALVGITAGVFCSIAGILFSDVIAVAGYRAPLAIVVVSGLFGAWAGGLCGMSLENHKIRRFHDAIAAGFYLIMVDAGSVDEQLLSTVMVWHPQVYKAGEDDTVITPFDHAV